MYIDCHLNWHDHIDYIGSKISKNPALEVHNCYTRYASSDQIAIPLFRTNLRRFCPSRLLEDFFGMALRKRSELNQLQKLLKRHFCIGISLSTSETFITFFYLLIYFHFFLCRFST